MHTIIRAHTRCYSNSDNISPPRLHVLRRPLEHFVDVSEAEEVSDRRDYDAAAVFGSCWRSEVYVEGRARVVQVLMAMAGPWVMSFGRSQKLRVKRCYRVQTELVMMQADLSRDSQVVDNGVLPVDHSQCLTSFVQSMR